MDGRRWVVVMLESTVVVVRLRDGVVVAAWIDATQMTLIARIWKAKRGDAMVMKQVPMLVYKWQVHPMLIPSWEVMRMMIVKMKKQRWRTARRTDES